ncbi:hypothetical protein M0R45_021686 [Rubus argutus]|uniref:Uncharacterized protein n=1 Tax=Rubus argutus TaxID=59490 RepID=A0AAW1XC55_RUBAR
MIISSPGGHNKTMKTIVDVLLKIVKEQTGFGAAQLGHNNIKAVLLDLFIGGIDTSSITMVWGNGRTSYEASSDEESTGRS